MKLFDFFFPEQAQAAHLRKLSESQSFAQRRHLSDENTRARRHAEIDRRVESLEQDVGFLTLMLEAVVRKTEEKGVLTRDDLKNLMRSIDAEDGRTDGQYRPDR